PVVSELLDLPADERAVLGERVRGRLRDPQLAPEPQQAIERGPAHHPRMGMALGLAALFPDAVIGLAPRVANGAAEPEEHPGSGPVELAAVLDEIPDGGDELPVEIELELAGRRVAHPDRTRAAESLQL